MEYKNIHLHLDIGTFRMMKKKKAILEQEHKLSLTWEDYFQLIVEVKNGK